MLLCVDIGWSLFHWYLFCAGVFLQKKATWDLKSHKQSAYAVLNHHVSIKVNFLVLLWNAATMILLTVCTVYSSMLLLFFSLPELFMDYSFYCPVPVSFTRSLAKTWLFINASSMICVRDCCSDYESSYTFPIFIIYSTHSENKDINIKRTAATQSLWFFGTPQSMSVCNQRRQTYTMAAQCTQPQSLSLIPMCHPQWSQTFDPQPTSMTGQAVHVTAIPRSVTLASHDILSHRQPHSSSVSSCEGAWDPATGGGHFKGRPAHSCSLSLQQPAPVCNHY